LFPSLVPPFCRHSQSKNGSGSWDHMWMERQNFRFRAKGTSCTCFCMNNLMSSRLWQSEAVVPLPVPFADTLSWIY
jgi:hypothetical protein